MTWTIRVSRQNWRPPFYALATRREGSVIYGFSVSGWTPDEARAKARAKINGGWTKPCLA